MSSSDSSTHSSSSSEIAATQSGSGHLLKTLVVGMAILIVLGLAVVATTVVTRSLADEEIGRTLADAESNENNANISLRLPPGVQIRNVDLDDHRLLLHLRLLNGNEQLMIINSKTGALDKDIPIEINATVTNGRNSNNNIPVETNP